MQLRQVSAAQRVAKNDLVSLSAGVYFTVILVIFKIYASSTVMSPE